MKKHPFDSIEEQDAIKSAIKRISLNLGKTPTQKQYKSNRKLNEPSLEQITYRYGTWSKAVTETGLEPNPFQVPPRQPVITKQQLADEFIKVSNELGHIPSMLQFRVHSILSWKPYETNWGSWRQAVNAILESHHDRFHFDVKTLKQKEKTFLGKHLGISCPLLFEPRNEYETIALFCILAEKLGYKIKSIKSEFPDAILIKDDLEVLAEYEYLSSNYLQHGHPLEFNGIIICWRKDVDVYGIKILSLEEYIKNGEYQK